MHEHNSLVFVYFQMLPIFHLGFSDKEQADDIIKEALQMRDLDHPNVMSLIGVCHDESTPYIVMSYMANGSLWLT